MFPTGTPIKAMLKQVAFAEDLRLVVRGSDHSSVYVFDRRTRAPLDVLHHADKGLVTDCHRMSFHAYKVLTEMMILPTDT